ncbi:hypothetical protein NCCP2716_12870 [Sporosarcina sp. NCCP-2716]|uniref:prepilin-type N-terminal cleavage/methylation domain-containing protein n=1 Tax=Sporosarcina sp. NCCP-2716 TaxID=2943679 RepID=UPI00203EACCA|nr:prepilin-type N-terminal cleavage/methylation domain-containing protein [Sporosarcina sp. NCCP-2716]GKV68789.1 hypothetical protein NCCP2716_12870 [Sporosarcina sp. NCCP-2716]
MKKFLQKKLKNEKGLTLVELLAVIVILGIIAAIAVPAIGNIIDNSRVKAIKADAQTILSASNLYFAENSDEAGPITLKKLSDDGYIKDAGSFKIDENTTVKKVSGGNQITGTGANGKKQVTFKDATSKDISKKTEDGTTVKSSDI